MKPRSEKLPRGYGERFMRRPDTGGGARERKPAPPVETWSWKPHDPVGAMLQDSRADYPEAIETNYRPGKERQDVVLVFSCGWSTKGLLAALETTGLTYFYLDFDEFTARGKVDLRIEAGSSVHRLTLCEVVIDLRDVAAVLWDPPLHMFAEPTKDRSSFLYVHRWRQLLRDLRGLIRRDALWLPSHPLNGSQEWQNKFSELAIAKAEGLAVPETLCTNDPQAALDFVKQSPGSVMFREYSRAAPLFPLVFVTGKPTLRDFRDLVAAPCVFQRYVEKAFEVRAVLVGDEIFACRIDSQASKEAAIDWRVYDNAHVRWDRMRLPNGVRAALLRIGRRLDLALGSFDLMKGKDGRYYFLEVNRPGATYWLLPFVGLDISKETIAYIARWLTQNQLSSST